MMDGSCDQNRYHSFHTYLLRLWEQIARNALLLQSDATDIILLSKVSSSSEGLANACTIPANRKTGIILSHLFASSEGQLTPDPN